MHDPLSLSPFIYIYIYTHTHTQVLMSDTIDRTGYPTLCVLTNSYMVPGMEPEALTKSYVVLQRYHLIGLKLYLTSTLI